MELQIINQQEVLGKNFTIYGTADEPLFLAKDVAEWIEHSDTQKMINNIDEDEKLMRTLFASGQNRQMWFLTEDGLYEVLMQSRKPIAKQFKKKVKAILKSIRRTGGYTVSPETVNEDALIYVLETQKSMRQRQDVF
ncbi:BRO-N domain-containing protein, partial [Streptococcus suis]